MGETTAIEWTHRPGTVGASWNPWQGCHKVSTGCKNCYMFRDKLRYGQDPTKVVRSAKATFNAPLKWKEPHTIFVCSWSDFFIEEADKWRDEAWNIMRAAPQHTYLILTKRPERITENLPPDWGPDWLNTWLGVTAEDQEWADIRLSILRHVPARTRFVSCEPLLEQIMLDKYLGWLNWAIIGGESGSDARPMDLDWARALRDECAEAGVAYFYKQAGGNRKVDGVWGGRVLDGRTWDEYPIQEMT